MKNYSILIIIALIILFVMSDISHAQIEQPLPSVIINENLSYTKSTQIKDSIINVSLSKTTISLAPNSLISIKHPWTPTNQNIYLINANVTTQHIQRRLFSDNAKLDLEARNINGDNNYSVSFTLDPIWDRIVYSQKNGNWIKSYGDHIGDYQFSSPKGMTVDARDTIFVADYYNGKIVKLYYNYSQNKLFYVSSFAIPGINSPADISIEQSGKYYFPELDRVWIADDVSGKIIQIKRSGEILSTIEYYTVPGKGTFRLNKPIKILARERDIMGLTYISFIDEERNSFIVAFADHIAGTNITAYRYTEFDKSISKLTSIGLDINYEYWVTDEKMKVLHKFNYVGTYLASFDNGHFTLPQGISRVPILFTSGGTYGTPYLFTTDTWGSTTGLRAYLPGVDIVNLSIQETSNSFNFSFTLTNQCYLKAEIIKYWSNDVLHTFFNNNVKSAGKFSYTINKSILNTNEFRFRISAIPYYNSYYGTYQQNWKTYILKFPENIMAPVIYGFTQTPTPIYRGESGWVICHLSQGNGNLTYSWRAENFPSGASATFEGNNAYIMYNSFKLLKGIQKDTARWATLTCTALNAVGYSNSTTIVYFSSQTGGGGGGAGCPFVYTWNGEVWVEDNNILPQSEYEENRGIDVTDYYQLFTKPKLESAEGVGKYRLAVGEFEQERSYFDQFKLLVIDHPNETLITVNDSGRVIQFAKPAYFASAALDSEDVYKQLYELDGLKTKAAVGDTLKLSFEESAVGIDKYVLLIAQVQAAAKKKIAGEVLTGSGKDKETFTSFRLRRNPSYQWVLVPGGNSSSIQVDIVWKGEAEVDYTELSHKLELPFTLYTPQLLTARHLNIGDVTDLLRNWDESYAELNPNEWIDLEFGAPPIIEGMQRSFVFVSRGRYEKIEEKSVESSLLISRQEINKSSTNENIPNKYELYQNNPNPFNPITIINYQLPVNSHVTLKVYDLLGREVATLVDELKDAGYYDAEFNASAYGGLSSGVYYYRLTAGSFVVTKKMLLTR